MMLTGIAAIGWNRNCGATAVYIEVDTGRYLSWDVALKLQTATQAIYEAS